MSDGITDARRESSFYRRKNEIYLDLLNKDADFKKKHVRKVELTEEMYKLQSELKELDEEMDNQILQIMRHEY